MSGKSFQIEEHLKTQSGEENPEGISGGKSGVDTQWPAHSANPFTEALDVW